MNYAMRYEYYFCTNETPWLVEFLKEACISYKRKAFGDGSVYLIFSLYSTTPDIDIYLDILKKRRIVPSVNREYSAKDLSRAKLLIIRPYKYFFDIINEDEAFHHSCLCPTIMGGTTYVHKDQVASLAVRKEPALNTRTAFWSCSGGGTEIFVDKRILELAQENNLCGLRFDDVLVKKQVSENIFQLTTDRIIDKSKIGTGYGERVFKCPACGKEEYYIERALYEFHLDYRQIELDSDLYRTEGIKGRGCPTPKYLISQRFYQLLKDHKLTGNIAFTPVEDI